MSWLLMDEYDMDYTVCGITRTVVSLRYAGDPQLLTILKKFEVL